jgi:hypothetical protein
MAQSRRNLFLRLSSFQRATPSLGDPTRIPKQDLPVKGFLVVFRGLRLAAEL